MIADTSRFRSVTPTPQQLDALGEVRFIFHRAEVALLARVPAGRYGALMLTALEEAAMWATKAVTHEAKPYPPNPVEG